MYSCILFDLDGTLIDTREISWLALRDALKECTGKDFPADELDALFGVSVQLLFEREELGLGDFEEFRQAYEDSYVLHSEEPEFYPGAREALEELGRLGVPMGVITAKERWEYDHDFHRFGHSRYFLRAVCQEDVEFGKPHPEPVLKFFELTGIDKSGAVYVGDTEGDEQAAHGAGIDFAFPAWNGCPPVKNSDVVLDSPADLIGIAKK